MDFKKSFGQFQWLSLLAFGVLAGTVFSFGWPAVLLPIFLLPLIHTLINSTEQSRLRTSLWHTTCFFAGYYAVVMSWLLDADINGLVSISPEIAEAAKYFSWTIVVIVLTVFTLVLPYLVFLNRRLLAKYSWLWLVVVPSAWLLAEWLRSVGFSIFLAGPDGTIGDYWNFGSLGLAMMETPLAAVGNLVGMYGLSFLVVVMSVILYWLATRTNLLPAASGISLLVIVILAGNYTVSLYGKSVEEQPTMHGSVFQIETQAPDFFKKKQVDNHQDALKDLIVLPEYSGVFREPFVEFADTNVNQRLTENGVSINVSEGGNDENWYGTLEFRDDNGDLVSTQTKELLIPTGEYLPYILTTFYTLTGQASMVDTYNASRKVEKGSPPEVFFSQDLAIGPVACSGILGRNIYRNLTRDGAEVLTNSASLLIFNRSQSYFRQSLQMAKFHAIANNRTFIQASKAAPAFVIDESGNFILEPSSIETKFADFSFNKNSRLTPYTILGEWVLHTSALLAVIGVALAIKANQKPHRKKR